MSDFGRRTSGGASGPVDAATLLRISRLETVTAQAGETIPAGESVYGPFGEVRNDTAVPITLGATNPSTKASLLADGLTEVVSANPLLTSATDLEGVAVQPGKEFGLFGKRQYTPVAGNWSEVQGTTPVLVALADPQGVAAISGKSFAVFGTKIYTPDVGGDWDEFIATGGGIERLFIDAPQALAPNAKKEIKRLYLIDTTGATPTGTEDQTVGAVDVVDYTLTDGTIVGQEIAVSWYGDHPVQIQGNIEGATNYLLHDSPRSTLTLSWDGTTWRWTAENTDGETVDHDSMTFSI